VEKALGAKLRLALLADVMVVLVRKDILLVDVLMFVYLLEKSKWIERLKFSELKKGRERKGCL
jgi:hypothetical protein